MSMTFKETKWIVLYYTENGVPTFERFNTKDEVMSFIEEEKEDKENGFVFNDYTVIPPKSDLQTNEIVLYGVPDLFLNKC